MKNALKTVSACCPSCGRWFFRTYKTRPPKMCTDCAEYSDKENNKLRQRRFRANHSDPQKPHSKRSAAGKPRPVPVGSREGTERATRKPDKGGLFSNVPEPARTTKRKALGLP